MRAAVVLACVLLVVLVPACRRGARDRRTVVRPVPHQGRLLEDAGRALECAATLSVTRLDPHAVEVAGCGRVNDYVWADGGWAPMRSISSRAGTDLGCAMTGVHVVAPALRVRAATGCGRTVRYDLVCEDAGCDWIATAHSGRWADQASSETSETTDVVAQRVSMPPGPLTSTNPYGDQAPTHVATEGEALVIPDAPTARPVAEIVAERIDAARISLRRCERTPFVMHATWNAEGAVSFTLDPPFAGTAAETCVRAVLGAPHVRAAAAGEVTLSLP